MRRSGVRFISPAPNKKPLIRKNQGLFAFGQQQHPSRLTAWTSIDLKSANAPFHTFAAPILDWQLLRLVSRHLIPKNDKIMK